MRLLIWLIVQAVTFYLLAAGFVFDVTGALNVLVFATWLHLAMAFMAMDDLAVEGLAARGGPSVPPGPTLALALVVTVIWIWHGWWITGIAAFVGAALHYAALQKVEALLAPEAP